MVEVSWSPVFATVTDNLASDLLRGKLMANKGFQRLMQNLKYCTDRNRGIRNLKCSHALANLGVATLEEIRNSHYDSYNSNSSWVQKQQCEGKDGGGGYGQVHLAS